MNALGRSLIVGFAAFVLAAGCVGRRPVVVWGPSPLSQTIEPNGFRVVSVSFTSDTALENVTLQASPSLRPYVTITPSSFARIEAGLAKRVRLAVTMPPWVAVGSFVGWLQIRTGRRVLAPGEVEVKVVASTPEGALESLRVALEERNAAVYAAQFLLEQQSEQRQIFERQTDVALDALARTLKTAERVSLSDDGATAEYRVALLLGRDRFETTITLGLDARDNIWRVLRF